MLIANNISSNDIRHKIRFFLDKKTPNEPIRNKQIKIIKFKKNPIILVVLRHVIDEIISKKKFKLIKLNVSIDKKFKNIVVIKK